MSKAYPTCRTESTVSPIAGKAIATCNCISHKKRKCENKGSCQCEPKDFVHTELVYSVKAEDFVCAKCKHYPVWSKPELTNVNTETTDASFSQDLRAILATWNLEPDDEDSPGEKWLVSLANKGA